MKSRVFSTLAAACLAALAVAATPSRLSADAAAIDVTGTPLPLNSSDEHQVRVGRLLYRGGIELRADNVRFGGLSGLDISTDGATMTAMSDNGRWVRSALHYDAQGYLSGAGRGVMKAIRPAEGYPLKGNWRDAESIAPDGSGGYFVAFERQHRIWHYRTPPPDVFDAVPVPLKAPDDIAEQPSNGGIEAMARLCDRRLLIISEMATSEDGSAKAWVFDGKQWKSLGYAVTGSFHPTGAAVLPDCSLIVLERSFSLVEGVRARVTQVPAKAIRPGATLRGEELAQLVPPLTVDNMEGVATRKGADGEPLIYLVSDDNFSGFQRTILMMFALLPPEKK
jgi:hypothetical protein